MTVYYAGHAVTPRTPGPEPVSHLAFRDLYADRGLPVGRGPARQRVRYALPTLARTELPAVVLAVAAGVAAGRFPSVPAWVLAAAVGLVSVRFALRSVTVVLRARCYTVTFHERGFEVATGVLHRSKRFIWYHQLVDEPTYLRTPAMFLTHTASLEIRYDRSATVHQLLLAGIGSPAEVDRIRAYIETRRLAERAPIRGFLT